MIYSQSGILYDIFLDALWFILYKAKKKYGPHVDGIVGSMQNNSTNLLSN
jgi:hypothetical protein